MDATEADCGALVETTVFLSFFKDLPDHRQPGKVIYPLDEILLLCLLAVLAGAETFTDIARFGEKKLALLRRFRPFANGTPAHDHLGDIFATLDAEAFGRCFVTWISALVKTPAEVIAIDGKTSRRSGSTTEALLAQIAVSKYADGLPLYRQEAIYARDKVDLDRALMAQWMGRLGFELESLAGYVFTLIKKGERIFADETTLPTLAPGSGSTKTAYLWAYARDDRPFGGSGPPMVAYRFEDSRSGDCVARHLGGYRGILQVDGYAAYNRLARPDRGNDAVTLAGCWSHVRRKFYELHVAGSSELATSTIERMSYLWKVEENARGKAPDERVAARRQTAAAIVADLFELWEKALPRISGKSKLAEAIRYAISRRLTLERFLNDGRIEIDSNIVERAIRPQTITRKNSLFAGSDGGGRTWASLATLLQTAKMNDVDPQAWLTKTLERIATGWPNNKIDALMPWNYAA